VDKNSDVLAKAHYTFVSNSTEFFCKSTISNRNEK